MQEASIRVNRFFFGYVFYCTVIFLVDIIRTVLPPLGYWLLFAVVFTGVLWGYKRFLKRYFVFSPLPVSVWDVVPLLLLLGIFLGRVYLPDHSFDTENYHVYLQLPFIGQQVGTSFFPSRVVNTFVLPLAERLAGPFREVLGYRLGTIGNTLVLGVVYFQLKEFLGRFFIERPLRASGWMLCGAVMIFVREVVYQQGTYFVDMLLLPFLLAFVHACVHEGMYRERHELLWLAYLAGITVSLKLSAGGMVLCLLMAFLFASRRALSGRLLLAVFFLLLLPGGLYLWGNYQQTQNPLYPFFNGIFQSPFFSGNSQEVLYPLPLLGPQNLGEAILWPIYGSVFPARESAMPLFSGLVLIAAAVWFLVVLFERKSAAMRRFLAVLLLLDVYWVAVCYGYIRYNIVFEMMGTALVCWYIVSGWRRRGLHRAAAAVLGILLCSQAMHLGYYAFSSDKEYGWRLPWYQNHNKVQVQANMEMLFRDRDSGVSGAVLDPVHSWLVLPPSTGTMSMLKPGIPMVCFLPQVNMAGTVNAFTDQVYESCMQRYLGHGMYTILSVYSDSDSFLKSMRLLQEHGIIVNDFLAVQPYFMDRTKKLQLAEVVPAIPGTSFASALLRDEESAVVGSGDGSVRCRLVIFLGLMPEAVGWPGIDGMDVECRLEGMGSSQLLQVVHVPADGSMQRLEFDVPVQSAGYEVVVRKKYAPKMDRNGDWLMALSYLSPLTD